MGHEYVGIVEEVGSDVPSSGPASSSSGRSSPRTTPARSARPVPDPLRAPLRLGSHGAQAEYMRVPLADGTLVATPEAPSADLIPSLLAASDVWAPAGSELSPPRSAREDRRRRRRRRGRPSGVLAAKQLGAARIIAMSRHEPSQQLAREFGATDIVEERGDEGVARDQGTHRRPGRALGDRSRRHPGIHDAGHPRHPPRRPRRLRRRLPRRRRCPAWKCSSPTSTSTVAPPRSATTCPS